MTARSAPTNVIDLDSRREGFTLHRVQAALAGCFDASLLTDDEAMLFDDLFGASLDVPATAYACAFQDSFIDQPNTDL